MTSVTTTQQTIVALADVAAGRYGSPVSLHVANETEYYPEVWGFNGTCMTVKCSNLDNTTISTLKTKAAAGGGVLGYEMSGAPHVGMVQTVTDPEGSKYFVLTKYKLSLASQLPCDRAYGSSCSTYNTLALVGHIMSTIMVSPSLPEVLTEISISPDFKLDGGDNDFYGWVYDINGTAVAHGNGGIGRVLDAFAYDARFEAANQGGGYVYYNSSRRYGNSSDAYGNRGY